MSSPSLSDKSMLKSKYRIPHSQPNNIPGAFRIRLIHSNPVEPCGGEHESLFIWDEGIDTDTKQGLAMVLLPVASAVIVQLKITLFGFIFDIIKSMILNAGYGGTYILCSHKILTRKEKPTNNLKHSFH